MTSKNVETALTYLTAGLRGDNKTCAQLLGDTFKWIDRAQGFTAESIEELLRSADEHAGWHDRVLDVERVMEAENSVIVQGTLTQTHIGPWRSVPPTGKRVTVPFCDITSFDTQGQGRSHDHEPTRHRRPDGHDIARHISADLIGSPVVPVALYEFVFAQALIPLGPRVEAVLIVYRPVTRAPDVIKVARPAREEALRVNAVPSRNPLDYARGATGRFEPIDDRALDRHHGLDHRGSPTPSGCAYVPIGNAMRSHLHATVDRLRIARGLVWTVSATPQCAGKPSRRNVVFVGAGRR
jgi:hypothetical protein